MKKLLLKVCGMRDKQNITDLIALSPDFMGFIFHEHSPRNITQTIAVEIPEEINKVGVFVNKTEAFILEVNNKNQLNSLQLHGNETPAFCAKMKAHGFQIIKAFNIKDNFDFAILEAYEPFCNYFLFDAFGKNEGGNGITFNWELLHAYTGSIPFLLSGGIDATMGKQIRDFKHKKLAGIDINSKFEISAAFKNINLIKTFTNEI